MQNSASSEMYALDSHGAFRCFVFGEGRLDLAEDAMKRSLSELPDDATSNFNFGLLCGAQGILDQAEAQYRRAIVLDPNFTAAYNNWEIFLDRRAT